MYRISIGFYRILPILIWLSVVYKIEKFNNIFLLKEEGLFIDELLGEELFLINKRNLLVFYDTYKRDRDKN